MIAELEELSPCPPASPIPTDPPYSPEQIKEAIKPRCIRCANVIYSKAKGGWFCLDLETRVNPNGQTCVSYKAPRADSPGPRCGECSWCSCGGNPPIHKCDKAQKLTVPTVRACDAFAPKGD